MSEEFLTYQDGEPFPGVIGRTTEESVPAWPTPEQASKGAPNVLIFVLDDVGFGQLSSFGGLVETTVLDRLAANGLRYTNMHTTALCSPSRGAILTGRNHHSLGLATISETSSGYPGYNAILPFDKGMLSEMLLPHGYNTFLEGKWHLSPPEHQTPAGPYDRWPLARGFERFYGFLGGDTNQWYPDLVYDNHCVEQPSQPEDGYHLSADLADTGRSSSSRTHTSTRHHTQYYEMFGHRSIYHDGWRAVCPWPGPNFTEAAKKGRAFSSPITAEVLTDIEANDWELYDLTDDYAETHNVAADHRDKLIEMVGRWWAEAGKYDVMPLDGDVRARLALARPTISSPRNRYVYYPGGSPVPFTAAPKVYNRPFSITADAVVPADGAERGPSRAGRQGRRLPSS